MGACSCSCSCGTKREILDKLGGNAVGIILAVMRRKLFAQEWPWPVADENGIDDRRALSWTRFEERHVMVPTMTV